MDNPGKKPIIGILGGIASGKSTVAAEFAKLGCKIIDADEIAHELLDEPNVRSKIISYFGNRILGPEGKIDRNKLGDMAFSDAVKLSELNNIIHPVVLNMVISNTEEHNVYRLGLQFGIIGFDKMCLINI